MNTKTIKILDCTLRDGGYINNWKFGYENIIQIISNLFDSKIEYIECGFLKETLYNPDKSIFSSIDNLFQLSNKTITNQKLALMINFGEYSLDKLPDNENKNILLRISFKKENYVEAIEYCKEIKNKGYDISLNPMSTISYNKNELLELIKQSNSLNPSIFTIVDTNGEMKEKDVLSLFYLIENNLNKNISLGFHSHNSLKLSFINTQKLLKQNTKRTIVIDSTIFGMGRGAGNLCSEVLIQYINENYKNQYNIIPILKTIEEQINPIFEKAPWGYSVPYHLAAINSCHPNYATYLIKKQTLPIEIINKILKSIPQDKKSSYNKEIVESLYNNALNI